MFSSCPSCFQSLQFESPLPLKFCPFCGTPLPTSPISLLNERYELQKEIGKGGMGEVFLAYDKKCGRPIALKKIRSDLLKHPQIRRRFLKEAHITCKLTHPSIIPIYSIQEATESAYYTMPYVEGETLKELIKRTRRQEKNGEPIDHLGGSIPALMRIFINICQAVAYAHSKGILHRDLKLENIIIGKYGEVLILDWGLATFINTAPSEFENSDETRLPNETFAPGITRIGKIVGTIAYMAPERGLGLPATIQTDLYSLGVILYQLLALRAPFKRGTLEEFKKKLSKEEWVDPIQAAPYRDIPKILANITQKCLQKNPIDRYESVDEMIYQIENYIEGRSDWIVVAQLDIKTPSDWEFQEHVLIAEHVAITRTTEEIEWVSLMISQQSFPGNTRIETEVCLGENSKGIGLLFSVPETSQRSTIYDGYCLRIGSDIHRTTRLLRSNVELIQAPDIYLKRNEPTKIRIEKIDKTIHIYLNDTLQLSYITHLPLLGTHIGFLSSDSDFTLKPLKISVGSLNLTVNCLAVPDAFLAQHDFGQALSEYRRIAYSFPDRPEGREALFRAGLTLLEQAKDSPLKLELLNQALEEFEKLHRTPGGPLEYLGKALVYQALNEDEEEIKCFEIAYRRYPRHPLLAMLQEHILSRMNDVSRRQRISTYRFILLAARHFSPEAVDTHSRRLLISLQKHWEFLPFIQEAHHTPFDLDMIRLAIPLAFWLGQPYTLAEILEEIIQQPSPSGTNYENCALCLIELGSWELTKEHIERSMGSHPALLKWDSLQLMIAAKEGKLEEVLGQLQLVSRKKIDFQETRLLLFVMDQMINQNKPHLIHELMQTMEHCELPFDIQLKFNVRNIWAYLLEKNWKVAGQILYAYPLELLNKGTTWLHFLYGCWLEATEGRDIAMIHFMGLLSVSYPRTWNLAGQYLTGELFDQGWMEKAFFWEKRALYRALSLFYQCADDFENEQKYKILFQESVIKIEK